MAEIILKKPKKRFGETFEAGYYLIRGNGEEEFLHKYKNRAIEILRERIKEGEISGTNTAEERQVIRQNYLMWCEAVKKTKESKQTYWNKKSEATKRTQAFKMEQRIIYLEEHKKESIKEYDDKIKAIRDKINIILTPSGEERKELNKTLSIEELRQAEGHKHPSANFGFNSGNNGVKAQ